MEIVELSNSGLVIAQKALRLPFGKDNKSHKTSDIELLERLIKAGDEHAKVMRGVVTWLEIKAPIYWWREMETYRVGRERLSCESTMHIDCKGLSGKELQKAKAEIPMGKEQWAIDMFSYQCLRRIYKQRRHHRLPEWQEFCDFIEQLPFSKLITVGIK